MILSKIHLELAIFISLKKLFRYILGWQWIYNTPRTFTNDESAWSEAKCIWYWKYDKRGWFGPRWENKFSRVQNDSYKPRINWKYELIDVSLKENGYSVKVSTYANIIYIYCWILSSKYFLYRLYDQYIWYSKTEWIM